MNQDEMNQKSNEEVENGKRQNKSIYLYKSIYHHAD